MGTLMKLVVLLCLVDSSLSKLKSAEIGFVVNGRGQSLFAYYWRPSDGAEPRALVYLSHGYAEHLQHYEETGRRLADEGFLVFGHDHVGHGRSDGIRAHVDNYQDYVDDVLQHCIYIQDAHPGVPIFLVGHSMGGLISLHAVLKSPDTFKGVALNAPLTMNHPRDANVLARSFVTALSVILPQVPTIALDMDKITRNATALEIMKNDPLWYKGGVRAGWSVQIIKSIQSLGERRGEITKPVLILHGEQDDICVPEGSQVLFDRLSSADKMLTWFPLAYHNLYKELQPTRRKALDDTAAWIRDRL